MPLPRWVAHVNRRFTNRALRTFARRLPRFAIITHTGRRSGRTYSTPVNAFREGDGYLFALTYGAESDWVKNVMEAGGCEIETRRRHIRLAAPRIVTDPSRRWAPVPVRLVLGMIRATQYMRLTIADPSASGDGATS